MFIQDYRAAHGMTLEALGRFIRRLGAKHDPVLRVSDILLENLETKPNYKTVPALADLIATACDATPEQRDSIVLDKHRGTWRPPKRRQPIAERRQPIAERRQPTPEPGPAGPGEAEAPPRRTSPRARAVYAIDNSGSVVARYPSIADAALAGGVQSIAVRRRCRRKIRGNEFESRAATRPGWRATYRYSDEWDGMTEAQREADIHRAGLSISLKSPASCVGRQGYQRIVVAIDRQGREVGRYKNLKAAAAATGVSCPVLCRRANDTFKRGPYTRQGLAFRYADVWDAMTAEERADFLQLDTPTSPREGHP